MGSLLRDKVYGLRFMVYGLRFAKRIERSLIDPWSSSGVEMENPHPKKITFQP